MNVKRCDQCLAIYTAPQGYYLNSAATNEHWDLCSAKCLQLFGVSTYAQDMRARNVRPRGMDQ